MPERVGIAGFVSGRRYVADERIEQRYFTLYELRGLEALEGPGYVEVVERPTDWSLSMRPSFRNVVRRPCITVLGLGLGIAGSLATLRFGTGEPPGPWMPTWRDRLSCPCSSSTRSPASISAG